VFPQKSRDRQVFRSAGSVVLWWAWLVFAAASLVGVALGGHGHSAAVAAVSLVAITGVMYGCALRPRIVADENGINVLNPLRGHAAPWAAVTKVDLVYAIRVHCAPAPGAPRGKIIYSWAVQSSPRAKRRNAARGRRGPQPPAGRPAGYGNLPPESREALDWSSAEFMTKQLDERATRERASREHESAGSGPAVAGPSAGASPGPSGTSPVQVNWAWVPLAGMLLPALALIIVVLA
jgi:hypothetical protein